MILVTGSTGQLGGLVVQELLARNATVAALARDESRTGALKEQGAEVRIGSYDDVASLDRALDGVDRVLLVAGNESGRMRQHRNVIDAAARAGVAALGFTSRCLRDPQRSTNALMGDYHRTEDHLLASGVPHLIFRNALYMETVPFYAGRPGGIHLPAGEGRVAYAMRPDLAAGIAAALLHAEPDVTYRLTGSQAWSFDDVAAALTGIGGEPVAYTPIGDDEFRERMRAAGQTEERIELSLGFQRDIRDGQLDEVSNDLAELLGRTPTGLAEGLRTLLKV